MRRVIERQGYRVLESGTGQEGRAHIAADVKRWSAFLERAQIKLE